MPSASIDGNLVTIRNIRNFDYRTATDFTEHYYDKTFDLNKLESVDFMSITWGMKSIAHVIVSFGFGGATGNENDFVAFSIEMRNQKDQASSMVKSFFRQYELIYIVAVRLTGSLLGNVFIWSGSVFYPDYRPGEASWDLTPLQDQGAAGTIMMIESSIVTVLLLGWLFVKTARESEEQTLHGRVGVCGVGPEESSLGVGSRPASDSNDGRIGTARDSVSTPCMSSAPDTRFFGHSLLAIRVHGWGQCGHDGRRSVGDGFNRAPRIAGRELSNLGGAQRCLFLCGLFAITAQILQVSLLTPQQEADAEVVPQACAGGRFDPGLDVLE